MLRTIDLFLIILMITAAVWTFKVKSDAELAAAELVKLRSLLQEEHDAINILKADWSLLSKPSRLQALVENYNNDLNLMPLQVWQIAEINNFRARIIKKKTAGIGFLNSYEENKTVDLIHGFDQ